MMSEEGYTEEREIWSLQPNSLISQQNLISGSQDQRASGDIGDDNCSDNKGINQNTVQSLSIYNTNPLSIMNENFNQHIGFSSSEFLIEDEAHCEPYEGIKYQNVGENNSVCENPCFSAEFNNAASSLHIKEKYIDIQCNDCKEGVDKSPTESSNYSTSISLCSDSTEKLIENPLIAFGAEKNEIVQNKATCVLNINRPVSRQTTQFNDVEAKSVTFNSMNATYSAMPKFNKHKQHTFVNTDHDYDVIYQHENSLKNFKEKRNSLQLEEVFDNEPYYKSNIPSHHIPSFNAANDNFGGKFSESAMFHCNVQESLTMGNISKTVHDSNDDLICNYSENKTNLIVNYLPPYMTQDEVKALFLSIGEVESCKLVREKSTGESLGYAFVKFVWPVDADKAIRTLNGLRLQNKTIKVSLARPSSESIKGANLYICGLPKKMTQAELEELFSQCGKIITARILYDNKTGLSRGVAFIRFDQRHEAETAIKLLNGYQPASECSDSPQNGTFTVKFANSPNSLRHDSLSLALLKQAAQLQTVAASVTPPSRSAATAAATAVAAAGLFNPLQQIASISARLRYTSGFGGGSSSSDFLPAAAAVVNPLLAPAVVASSGALTSTGWCIFVYNLAPETEESNLWQLFGPFGAVQTVKIIRDPVTSKCKGFGFVTMSNYEEALLAIHSLNGFVLGERVLQVSFKTNPNPKLRLLMQSPPYLPMSPPTPIEQNVRNREASSSQTNNESNSSVIHEMNEDFSRASVIQDIKSSPKISLKQNNIISDSGSNNATNSRPIFPQFSSMNFQQKAQRLQNQSANLTPRIQTNANENFQMSINQKTQRNINIDSHCAPVKENAALRFLAEKQAKTEFWKSKFAENLQ